jgi:cytochrome c biogenesis protein CcmG/thiol:disulfide interchange protein DsbE
MNRLAIAAVSVIVATAPSPPAVAFGVPHVGQPAPAFSLPTVDGKTLTLASLRGKPVYLNFYATWCPPCNEEAPAIGKLSQKFKSRGLVVLGVNELESAQKAREFLTKYHLPYTAVVDADGKAGEDYGVSIGLPVHVFIDRNGNVKTYRPGEMTPGEIETAIVGIVAGH